MSICGWVDSDREKAIYVEINATTITLTINEARSLEELLRVLIVQHAKLKTKKKRRAK